MENNFYWVTKRLRDNIDDGYMRITKEYAKLSAVSDIKRNLYIFSDITKAEMEQACAPTIDDAERAIDFEEQLINFEKQILKDILAGKYREDADIMGMVYKEMERLHEELWQ